MPDSAEPADFIFEDFAELAHLHPSICHTLDSGRTLVAQPEALDSHCWRVTLADGDVGRVAPSFAHDRLIWTALPWASGRARSGEAITMAGALAAIGDHLAEARRTDPQPLPPDRPAVSPPSGLPLPSTAPLTAKEREVIARVRRTLEMAVSSTAEALAVNRVDRALDALALAGEIGLVAQRCAALLGSGR